jgi:hypothetical protein
MEPGYDIEVEHMVSSGHVRCRNGLPFAQPAFGRTRPIRGSATSISRPATRPRSASTGHALPAFVRYRESKEIFEEAIKADPEWTRIGASR